MDVLCSCYRIISQLGPYEMFDIEGSHFFDVLRSRSSFKNRPILIADWMHFLL